MFVQSIIQLYQAAVMTRTAHHSHPTPAFPVYTADWVADDKLILGGGGGASRSGIKNKLVSTVQVPPDSYCAAVGEKQRNQHELTYRNYALSRQTVVP
jgi:hypothetical protein